MKRIRINGKYFSMLCYFLVITVLLLQGCGHVLIYDLNDRTGRAIAYQNIPGGISSLYSEDCGECHAAIYKEWRTSMHSKAFTDPFFQAYWQKDAFEWSCLTCHTPLQNQQKVLVEFRGSGFDIKQVRENVRFDKKLQEEGITCAVCHVRDGIIYGPFKKEDINAPHPVGFDEKFLSETICLQCHQVPAKRFSFLKSAVCSTGNEWFEGPYKKEGYICQSCHMPSVDRPLMEGMKSRKGRQHLWKGGSKKEQVQKALTVLVHKKGDDLIEIKLVNSGAGHYFPTGDPDRKVIVKIDLLDEQKKPIKSEEVVFERVILWKPIMIELWDSRLPPKGEKTILLKAPLKTALNNTLRIEAIYQILTERAQKKLENNYGLKNYPPVRYIFFQKLYDVDELPQINPGN